jgi:pimeloyl-ACP methyl ester carboxylesterase
MFELPSPGRRIRLGDRRLHAYDLGTGSPAVVLEAGAGGWSSHWGEVPRLLSRHTRVIAYDRAGLGWSDFRRGPVTGDALAHDLVTMRDVLGVREPIVLVGHSFGAAVVRLMAGRYPSRVAGMVFVDGWHESMAGWERARNLRLEPGALTKLAHGLLARFGVLRALVAIFPTPAAPWPIETDTWRAILAISCGSRHFRTSSREAEAADAIDLANSGQPRMGAPISVLVARETLSATDAPSDYPIADHNAAWVESSSRLAELSADSDLTILERCDHMIHLRQPDVVVDAVLRVIEKARARTPATVAALPNQGVAADGILPPFGRSEGRR